ncbi:hypothetical protein [Kitasatospora sp. NBC_01266]|uniref:hypothetical protein n=1 Tax=Kitasatospora sp. NBC_01266 TaxID=2903572 RepID=UPI002E357C12|nr:hypothetical protein [Kitasatospora sp. NBC_01266]
MSPDDSSARARQLIASWLEVSPDSRPGPPALPVPQGAAAEVIATARRIALPDLPDLPAEHSHPNAPPELLRLAMALVVDEHPSAATWFAADRTELARWVAMLIEHRGEDGVQDLVRALNQG